MSTELYQLSVLKRQLSMQAEGLGRAKAALELMSVDDLEACVEQRKQEVSATMEEMERLLEGLKVD